MKKICFIVGLVCALTATHASAIAIVNTINAPGSLIGTSVLNGYNAYSWAISPTVAPGQQIASATVNFNNITLTVANSSGTGFLYTDLLMLGGSGATVYTDYDASGDYFSGKYSSVNLGTQFFASVGTTLSWSYVLNSSQLVTLNNLLAGSGFSLGIDPDCHYSVGGLSFDYTTKSNNVPDGATTVGLLGLSLLGLEIFRRKSVAVRA